MLKGHLRKDCPNEVVCYQCRNAGHKKGDRECPALPQDDAEAEAGAEAEAEVLDDGMKESEKA